MCNSIRSEENGTLNFHKGTEEQLALFVKLTALKDDPESVIKQIDEFCWSKHWMMHVGDKKGKILDDIITRHKPKIILELGTYCGYSTIRMARFSSTQLVITIDPCPLKSTENIINHSGLNDKITQHKGIASDVIPTLECTKCVDMVFIDHEKSEYLNDLILIERSGLLHPGSVIVADNVTVFKINDYLKHVRNSTLYSSSINHPSTIEYDNSNDERLIDSIEESIYM